MKRLTPFDFIKSINEKTENLMDTTPDAEREYVPFVVNRGLSYSPDTILYANEMNCVPLTDKRMQYDYLYHSIRKRKRFDKWIKPEEMDEELLGLVMEAYKVGQKKAVEYIRMLPKERLDALRQSGRGSNAK
jgi:hypothetical protein